MNFKNHLEMVGHIAAHSALSAKYKDSDGNVKEILPEGAGNSFDLDQFRKDVFPSDTDTHPSDGDNIYPGSLANGEITERYILSQVETNPSKVTNLSFQREVGSKMNMVGDGLEFQGYLLKTSVTNGVKGTPKVLPIIYDPKNNYKEGYYVTTSPYPLHLKASSFKVNIPVKVSLNGIGENVKGVNHASPAVEFTFKPDQTMDVKSIQGYDNDGASNGMNGFIYDLVINIICTYSTQEAVSQLPDTINLFVGKTNGDVTLTGASEHFVNIPNGLEVTLDDDFTVPGYKNYGGKISKYGIPKIINITKGQLIEGYKINLADTYSLDIGDPMEESKIVTSSLYIEIKNGYISFPGWITTDTNQSLIRGYDFWIDKVKPLGI